MCAMLRSVWRICSAIAPALVSVLLDELEEHAEHLSCVLPWTVEVRDLISREFERGGHDEAALRVLILRHGEYFTGCHKCFAALSTNGERTELALLEHRRAYPFHAEPGSSRPFARWFG